MSSLCIDRERFVLWASVLAAPGCAESPPPEPAAPEALVQIEPSPPIGEVQAAELPEPLPEPAPAASSRCDETPAEIDCNQLAKYEIGPTCEGLVGSCRSLSDGSYGYGPRVAEAIGECLLRLGRRACHIQEKKRCIREALSRACVDPQYEARCQATMDRCRGAGVRVEYSLQQCMEVMSAVVDRGNRDWALGAMGPAREGCRLMFPVY